jgi:hypothetical protein
MHEQAADGTPSSLDMFCCTTRAKGLRVCRMCCTLNDDDLSSQRFTYVVIEYLLPNNIQTLKLTRL